MIFHYLDASAWIKRYYREIGTDYVQGLFAQNQAFACASLGLVEVVATLARKRKAGEIDEAALEQTIKELDEDWGNFVQIHLTAETVDTARQVARGRALRGADAIHLASALVLQRRFAEEDDRLIIVTADRELKDAAQLSGLTVLDPQELLASSDLVVTDKS